MGLIYALRGVDPAVAAQVGATAPRGPSQGESGSRVTERDLAARDAAPRRRRPLGRPETLLKAIVVFNLIDALLTLYWIGTGRALEANFLMKDLAENRPVLFVAVKLLLVSLGTLLLWRFQKLPAAVAGMVVLFFAFYAVLVLHFNYLGFLIRLATGG